MAECESMISDMTLCATLRSPFQDFIRNRSLGLRSSPFSISGFQPSCFRAIRYGLFPQQGNRLAEKRNLMNNYIREYFRFVKNEFISLKDITVKADENKVLYHKDWRVFRDEVFEHPRRYRRGIVQHIYAVAKSAILVQILNRIIELLFYFY